MPEHRALIPKSLLLIIEKSVLVCRAHTASSALWSKAKVVAVAIVEAVHLFFDNIGDLTNGALEKLSLLKDWKPNLLITKPVYDAMKRGFERLPG